MRNFTMRYFKPLFLFLLSLMVVSCEKQQATSFLLSEHAHSIIGIRDNSKTNQEYVIWTSIGHDGTNCKGCVLRNGQWKHIDCQGQGNACSVSPRVILYSSGNSAYIVTTDTFGLTDQDFFNMPSRSLFVEYDDKNNEVWLNIPAQLV